VIQAPMQYFVPNNDNRRPPGTYDSAQYPTARDERLQLRRNPDTSILYSNDAQTENRPTYRDGNDNYYPPAATATVYSETRVDGLPRYSYGYKIIDGRVGSSNDQHDAPAIVGGDRPTSHNSLSDPDETDGVLESTIGHRGAGLQAAANGRKPDESDDRRDDGPDNIPRALKPIVVKTESNTTKTELKKYYKKVKNPETPIKETKKNEKLTTINPAQR